MLMIMQFAIFIKSDQHRSSSSWCRAASMDIPDPLSTLFPIVHHLRQVFRATSHISSHSCCIYVLAGRPAFAWPYVEVHWSTSLISSSLLLQQYPASWIVFMMGGKWPYSWCFFGCCRQDLFNIALNILV